MSELEWSQLRAPQLRSLSKEETMVILPVGSIEQHGPHLPVQVDALLTTEVSLEAASRFNPKGKVLVAPTVWCGLAEHHMDFGGTFTLDHYTYQSLIRCLCMSILRHGFRKICIVNGHGGNINSLNVIAAELKRELDLRILVCTYWTLPEVSKSFDEIMEKQSNVLHAGEAETSMLLYLKPELVDKKALSEADEPPDLKMMGQGAYRWKSFKKISPNGVIGFPSVASAEKGSLLLDTASGGLCRLLEDPETWSD